MAVQNDNTILNKGDLKAYHQKILPYLGGNMMVNTSNSDYYSTDEKVVGIWLDGKPLYQKTFTGTTTSASCTVANLTSLNIDGVYGFRGAIYLSTLGWMPFNYSKTDYITGYYLKSSKTLEYRSDSSYATVPYYITLQYTKTTDTAGSATTTPGAYDINFPNTWPVNTEIYFGNGVYGKRYTGDFSIAANTRTNTLIDSSLTQSNWFVMSVGGYFDTGSGIIAPIGSAYGASSAPTTLGVYSYLYANTSGVRLIHYSENARSNAPYDIWVTYTK